MKTYTFKVVREPNEDGFSVYYPALMEQGAAVWGTGLKQSSLCPAY
jgi:hypothetical protein